jgi:hypothetical protein
MFVSKPEKRLKARELRGRDGLPIREIAVALDVAVSSVSTWVSDVPLTPEQEAALVARNPVYTRSLAGHRASAANARRARVDAQAAGREQARAADPLHRTGCMLYWGEGSKSRNVVALTNADPDMLAIFVRFLHECYDVPHARMCFSVNCHLNNGLTLDEIERWWLDRLGLPTECLRKAVVNRPSRASNGRHNVLLYGTARVVVNSTAIVQSIYGAIQEYAGIERPEWLDCSVAYRRPA